MRQRDDRAPASSSSSSSSLPPSAAALQHSHRHRAVTTTITDMYAQLLSEAQFREATASATSTAGDASALTAADAASNADDSARQRYAEYRTECERRRARSFFDAHRTHDWFRRCFDAAARAGGAELGAGADSGTVQPPKTRAIIAMTIRFSPAPQQITQYPSGISANNLLFS